LHFFRNISFDEEALPAKSDKDTSWNPLEDDESDEDSLYEEIMEEIMQDADISVM